MKKIHTIIISSAFITLCHCGPASEQEITDEFNKRGFIERVEYYKEIQPKEMVADVVFNKIVIPELDSCSFADLQTIKNIVEGTPVYADVDKIYTRRRDTALFYAENALFDFAIRNKEYWTETLVKNIYNELRSNKIVFNSMQEVIKEYKGFFGKIFDSEEDFEKEWNGIINSGALTTWANSLKCLSDYKTDIDTAYKKYIFYNCPQYTRLINLPDSLLNTFEMPQDIVAVYIQGEKQKTIDKTIGIVTDIASEIITARRNKKRGKKQSYEIDWNEEWDKAEDAIEQMEQNKNDDEKLAYALSESILVDVSVAIMDNYMHYIDDQTNGILAQLLPGYTPKAVPMPEIKRTTTADNNSNQSVNTQPKTETENKNTSNQASSLPGEYPFASERLLSASELTKYTKPQLRIMRNEIYARRGYIFISGGEMDKHFRAQSWYKPKYKDVNKMFTDIEKKNIQTISTAEKK